MDNESDSSYKDTSDSEYEEKYPQKAGPKAASTLSSTLSNSNPSPNLNPNPSPNLNPNCDPNPDDTSDSEYEEEKTKKKSLKTAATLSNSKIKEPTATKIKKVKLSSNKTSAPASLAKKNNKVKVKVYKKTNQSSWPNIFAQSKAVVSLTSMQEPSSMIIQYCDSDFLSTFGYTKCQNLSFNDLMGKASSKDTMKKFETCLYSGKTATEYINLYRSDKLTPLSCHVSLLPLKNQKLNPDPSPNPSPTSNPKNSKKSISSQNSYSSKKSDAVWGVLTVRSASVVGNARISGISFLGGMDRVTDDIREKYYGINPNTNPHSNPNSNPNPNSNLNPNTNSNPNPDTNSNPNPNPNLNPISNPNPNKESNIPCDDEYSDEASV
jgi:hypothetical protein